MMRLEPLPHLLDLRLCHHSDSGRNRTNSWLSIPWSLLCHLLRSCLILYLSAISPKALDSVNGSKPIHWCFEWTHSLSLNAIRDREFQKFISYVLKTFLITILKGLSQFLMYDFHHLFYSAPSSLNTMLMATINAQIMELIQFQIDCIFYLLY